MRGYRRCFQLCGRSGVLLLALCSLAGCGGEPTSPAALPTPSPTPAPTPTPVPPLLYSLDLEDPWGDVARSEEINPDLLSGRFEVRGSELKIVVRFEPGTFSRNTTSVTVELDTDGNPATGASAATCPTGNYCSEGADYDVTFGSTTFGSLVRVTRFGVGGGGATSPTPVVFSDDGLEATLPLSLLGGDDGRMELRVQVSRQLSPGSFTVILDFMPNRNAPMASLL